MMGSTVEYTYGYDGGSVYAAELVKLSLSAATAISLIRNPKLFQEITSPKPIPIPSVPSCECEECDSSQAWFWLDRNQSKVIRPKTLQHQGPVAGFQAYSNVTGFSLNSQTPKYVLSEMEQARDLIYRHKVRRPKAKNFRVLDHGPRWREQSCRERFRVVRWPGPNPPEWEKVGWSVGVTYNSRKEAAQAKKDLTRINDIMES
jgi:hypothetical protein